MKNFLVTSLLIGVLLLIGAVSLFALPRRTPPSGMATGLPAQNSTTAVVQRSAPVLTLPRISVATSSSSTSTTPPVGAPVVTPSMITAGISTAITVTVQITDPTLIAGSVNLLQVGPTDTQPVVIGAMQDTGNGIYTLQYQALESTPMQIQFQVSAAFRGLLKRILSPVAIVDVYGTFTDPITGITFSFPGLGNQSKIQTDYPTAAALSDLDITTWNSAQQSFVSVAGIQILSNSDKLSLQDWFARNVDVDNVLASNETFQLRETSDNIPYLLLVGQVPPDFLAVSGPVAQLYSISPDGKYIFSFSQSQADQLSSYGYDSTATFIQMLDSIKLP